MVTSLLGSADLTSPIPENTRRLADRVTLDTRTVETGSHRVFLLESLPPSGHFAKGVVLFLHGQAFSSATWKEGATMAVLSAAGYRCLAPDLPGGGRTEGPVVPAEERPSFILALRDALGLKDVMVVAASMAAPYVLPLLGEPWMQGMLAIAPSNTHQLGESARARTPVLVVYGEKDTSLGPTSAANLAVLPISRSLRIPNAGHAVHLGNAHLFQAVAFNFFELIRSYTGT